MRLLAHLNFVGVFLFRFYFSSNVRKHFRCVCGYFILDFTLNVVYLFLDRILYYHMQNLISRNVRKHKIIDFLISMQRKVSQFLTQCCMSNAYLMLSTCYKILGRLISNEHINLTVTFYRCLFSFETLINFFFVHVARLTFVTSFTTLFITLKCMISYCRQEKFSFVLT